MMVKKISASIVVVSVFACCATAMGGTIFVSQGSACAGACGTECGGDWRNSCSNLQAAIDAATSGDEVWVAAGTYKPISLKSDVKVYGGFAGDETAASESDPNRSKTTIDGGGIVRGVTSKDNSSSTVLRGFTIRNGYARGLIETGGGALLEDSDATFVQCVFEGNTADHAGGAIANDYGGLPTFVNCVFSGNGSRSERAVPRGGGAVFNHDASATFVNCLFHGNKAGEGGALLTMRGSITLTNCTLTDNEATLKKGGAIFDRRGKATLRNCIVFNNRSQRSGTAEIFNDASLGRATDIANSSIKGGWQGTGNINADPKFVDAANGDFRLAQRSPCRDKGNNAAIPVDSAGLDWSGNTGQQLPNDLQMKPRIRGTSVDMGALESQK